MTIAEKITKEDLHLDWSLPAVQLARVVRLGRAWTTFRGTRLTVLAAAAADAVAGPGQGAPGSLLGTTVVTGAGSPRAGPGAAREPFAHVSRGVVARPRPADGERLGTD